MNDYNEKSAYDAHIAKSAAETMLDVHFHRAPSLLIETPPRPIASMAYFNRFVNEVSSGSRWGFSPRKGKKPASRGTEVVGEKDLRIIKPI